MNENILYDVLNEKLPFNRKQTPSGWIKFNGVCCLHNHEKRHDTKQRAGLMITADGTITYNCLNCGFKTSWSRGHTLSVKMKQLLDWCGASTEDIKKIQFFLFQLKARMEDSKETEHKKFEFFTDFKEVSLPSNTKAFKDWINDPNISNEEIIHFNNVFEYVCNRGDDILESYDFHWSPSKDNNLYKRVIIPFKYRDKIVGWTARSIEPNTKLRYYTNTQPNYLFNNEVLYRFDRKYIIIVEGPFDAIAIDGVATLGGKISKQQVEWIKRSRKEIILLPDRDLKNSVLMETAIENGWSVSWPWSSYDKETSQVREYWERDVKDASDAVKKYGRLYTLRSIIDSKTNSELEIKMKFEQLKKMINQGE